MDHVEAMTPKKRPLDYGYNYMWPFLAFAVIGLAFKVLAQ